MSGMQAIDFNKLPETIRLRFIGALGSLDKDVAPIAASTSSLGGTLFWLILMTLAAGWMVYVRLEAGFGKLADENMWQENGSAIFYVIAIALCLYGLLAAARHILLHRGLPFKPGRYLFPYALIDARTAGLKMYDLAQVEEMKGMHKHTREGRYRGTDFVFIFKGGKKQTLFIRNIDTAESLFREMTRRQELAKQAAKAGQMGAVLQQDPLYEVRTGKLTPNKLMPGAGRAKAVPSALNWRAAIAVVAGMVIGFPLWLERNYQSDDATYAAVKASAHENDYQTYLRWGHRHLAEAREALPRVAFEEAKRSKSVTRLRTVLHRYPEGGLDDDVKAEVHQLYLASMAKFRAQATDADPTLVPFIEQLLGTLEASGDSTVQLRFTRPSSDDLGKMDRVLSDYAAKRGREMTPASPWFTPQSDAGREQRIIAGLQQGFAAIFPSDVMQIAATPKPNATQPLMDITYQIGGSGQYYESLDKVTMKPNGKQMFVGLICKFNANVSLPAQEPGWHFDLSVQPPDTFHVDYELPPSYGGVNPAEHEMPASRVYSVMAERAFDELHLKMRDALFRPDSDAYKRSAMITKLK